jgi:hypothetical protein
MTRHHASLDLNIRQGNRAVLANLDCEELQRGQALGAFT